MIPDSCKFYRRWVSTTVKNAFTFATNWQWLLGPPLCILLFTYLGQYFFKGLKIKGLPDTTTVSGALVVILIAFVITWIIGFIYHIINAPAILYRKLEDEYNNTKTQLETILGEYTYALQLESIDHLDVIEKTEGNNLPIRIAIQSTLKLRNTINRPLNYEVIQLEVNGITQNGLLTTGGGLSPLSSTIFRSNPTPVSHQLNEVELITLLVVIKYGAPDRPPIRKMTKKARITVVRRQSQLSYTYEIDKDESL